MTSITKIEMNGTLIEEKDGQIYINGKHIETGKPNRKDLTFAIFFGAILGVTLFGVMLASIEFLAKGLSS